jgi:ELWxxDGT repeat protein
MKLFFRSITVPLALSLAVGLGWPSTAGAGTVALIKDINTAEVQAGSSPLYLGRVNGQAVFTANNYVQQGQRLWRSDGTTAGTVAFAGAMPVEARYPSATNGRLVFFGFSSANPAVTELWGTNGSDAGTQALISLGSIGYSQQWVASDANHAWFTAGNNLYYDADLYVTDGTPAGTRRVTTGRRVLVTASVIAPDGGLYFFSDAVTGGDLGLWYSDGTVAGTHLLQPLAATGLIAVGPALWVSGNSVVLTADNSLNERGVYRIDVTTGATVRLALADWAGAGESTVEMGGLHYFRLSEKLWRSDGTVAGTSVISAAPLPENVMAPLVVLGNRLVFAKNDQATGTEIWTSDGTAAGTHILGDFAPGADGVARILTYTNERIYFLSGVDYGHLKFWVSDGTQANTREIPQRGGASYDLQSQGNEQAVVAGDRVYLRVTEVVAASSGFDLEPRLWATDLAGTDAVRLGSGGEQLQPVGNKIFFSSSFDPSGLEPWVSDGTVAGTFRLRDIAVTGQTSYSRPEQFTVVGSRAFFSAETFEQGRELWVTDGTSAGTRLVRDLRPGPDYSYPSGLLAVGGLVYFVTAADNSGTQAGFWRSDGTDAGTIKLLDIPVQAGSDCGSWAAEMNGRVWFFTESTLDQAALYSTDGTAAGTRREFTLPDEIRNSRLCSLTGTSQGLVFVAGSGFSAELWRTDGTAAGTFRIGAIRPTGLDAQYGGRYLTSVGGMVYLLADQRTAGSGTGIELWRSHGSEAGTALVADLTDGLAGASYFSMTRFGDGLVFGYRSMSGLPGIDGLYRVAGPGAAPLLLKGGAVGGREPVSIGALVFCTFNDPITATEGLWVSDGTSAGTREFLNSGVGSALAINRYAAGDGRLYYQGAFGGTGEELWMTDGTTAGTFQLSSFDEPYATFGYEMVVLNNLALFARNDPVTQDEPWIVVNAGPTAVNDAAAVSRDSTVLIDWRANDMDADSPAARLSVAIVTAPTHGSVVADGTGYRYTPAAGYTGSDFFEYRLTDEFGAMSGIARVTVTVDAPPGGGSSGGGGGGAFDGLALFLLAWFVFRRLRTGVGPG